MNKTVFIIVDGMADLPIKRLGNKTPLDYAIKNNLYNFLKYSELAYPNVLGKLAPQSDAGVMANLSYDPLVYSTGRGWFECLGLGLAPKSGELSVRVNFGSVSKGKLKDIRVYLSQDEIEDIINEINNNIHLSVSFDLKAGVGYRAGLVLRSGKMPFSHFVSNNEPGYTARFFGSKVKLSFASGIKDFRIKKIKPMKNEARYTAEVLNEFVYKASEIIKKSKTYKTRLKKGMPVPNYLFLRDSSDHDPELENINKKYNRKWAAITGMPLEKGIAESLGMSVIKMEELPNVEEDLRKKADQVGKVLSKFDAVYLHIKQPDSFSHLGKFIDKYAAIEKIDRIIISKLYKELDSKNDTLVLTCDHATSSEFKRHLNSNIPVLISNRKFDYHHNFSEFACSKEGNKKIKKAIDIMPFVMNL
ncbi:MAG: Phosphoglycerate mutase [Candidatus Parvarchaeum acidophilus ARMAN-5]|jgi:2,3-bisphosphoglycerate-independent phosphoglycerate mutase|uniref:Phosphoglycerate mutase n=1 Tax=Candidatus Parvarchaeum acidophilus ARMAN-5 TaxID=662762 RepID=D6GVT6_PARA5|nr:MAG: Phosphoglycerate mutase [Candidatus Parvarchaeum acidophilus ARMAN-5]